MPVVPIDDRKLDEELKKVGPELAAKLKPVLKHPKFKAAVDELHDNPTARVEAAQDPAGFFRKHGIDIPPGLTPKVSPNWYVLVCGGPLRGYCCGYNSHTPTGWGCWRG